METRGKRESTPRRTLDAIADAVEREVALQVKDREKVRRWPSGRTENLLAVFNGIWQLIGSCGDYGWFRNNPSVCKSSLKMLVRCLLQHKQTRQPSDIC